MRQSRLTRRGFWPGRRSWSNLHTRCCYRRGHEVKRLGGLRFSDPKRTRLSPADRSSRPRSVQAMRKCSSNGRDVEFGGQFIPALRVTPASEPGSIIPGYTHRRLLRSPYARHGYQWIPDQVRDDSWDIARSVPSILCGCPSLTLGSSPRVTLVGGESLVHLVYSHRNRVIAVTFRAQRNECLQMRNEYGKISEQSRVQQIRPFL